MTQPTATGTEERPVEESKRRSQILTEPQATEPLSPLGATTTFDTMATARQRKLPILLFIGAIMINKLMGFTFLPPKATIHSYIGVSIFPLILIKICINRYFKKFYNSLPVYGVMVLMAIFFQTALYAPFHLHVHHHETDEKIIQIKTKIEKTKTTKDPVCGTVVRDPKKEHSEEY
jgi:hypothetical protein